MRFSNKSKSSADKIKNYVWNFGYAGFSVDENPEYIFSNEGNYPVQLIAESENGCKDSVLKTVTVSSEDGCNEFSQLYFPNSFSPNNDGVNDAYEIKSQHGEILTLEIFNRWGELVFKTSGTSVVWNGCDRKNKKSPQDLYPAIVTVKKQNETLKKAVNVFLIR